MWDARNGELVVRDMQRCARRVAYTPDGSRLVIGGDAGKISQLDTIRFEELSSFVVDESKVNSLACSPDGRWIGIGTENGRVILLDVTTGAEAASVAGSKGGPRDHRGTLSLFFSPDGRWLATGSGVSSLTLREVPTLAPVRDLVGHREEVFGLAFMPDGKRLVSGGRDGWLRVWNPETGGLLTSLEGHASWIWDVAVTPDGRRIATSSGDAMVRVWDSAPASVGWRERRMAARDRRALASDVDRFLSETRDAEAVVEHLATSRSLTESQRHQARALALERSVAACLAELAVELAPHEPR